MKKIKRISLILLVLFSINLIQPTISTYGSLQSNEELSHMEIEGDLDSINDEITNSIADDVNTNEELGEITADINTYANEAIVMKIDTPIKNHKLTGSFFLKGWAVAIDKIANIKVYIDNKLYGQATYGIERKDVNSKYPQYKDSLNSGFTMEIKGYNNGNHTVKVVATDINGKNSETYVNINVDNTTTSIMSKGTLRREQMISYLKKKNTSKSQQYIEEFVDFILEESEVEGINADILFAQIMHETGFLKFGGDVKEEQNNFAGLGATGNGAPGESFSSIQIGIRAVVQHLKAYASTEPLVLTCVDNRFRYVERGSAPYVEHLGIQENPRGKGWAAAYGYGYNILRLRDEVKQEPINYVSSILSFETTGDKVVGSKMTMIAQGSPSAETEYRFLVKDPSGYWKGLNDYSSKNSIEYTPTKTGDYRYVVHVKHKKSNADYDELKVIDFNVSGGVEANVESFKVEGETTTGSILKLTAKASTGDLSLYRFWIKEPSGRWISIQEFSELNSTSYIPKEPGNYRFVVHVKNKYSTNEYDELKYVDLNITGETLKKLIVIDPGHNNGGDDGSYATHNNITYIERDLNMQVSLKLKSELESLGFRVILTRNPGVIETLPLRESLSKRVEIANSNNADFFISIHHNTAGISSASGFEAYYSDAIPGTRGILKRDGTEVDLSWFSNFKATETEKVIKSKKIGLGIVDSVTSEMSINNRGLRNDDFYVVKNTTMPSLLVECGFITNPNEAKKLADQQRQEQMANIIAREIEKNL